MICVFDMLNEVLLQPRFSKAVLWQTDVPANKTQTRCKQDVNKMPKYQRHFEISVTF